MKKNIKIVSLLLSLLLVFSFIGCGGSDDGSGDSDSGTTTVLNIVMSNGGLGVASTKDQIKRFEEKYKDKSYASGKTGVKVNVNAENAMYEISQSTLSDGYHIIASSDSNKSLQNVATSGWLANIDSIVTEKIPGESKSIADKIPSQISWNFQSNNAYYGLPSSETYGGLTYDKDLFDGGLDKDGNGYYLSSDNSETTFHSSILNKDFHFTKNSSKKTVGPNGIAGDEDDGLPSSLYELIALCEHLNADGIKPFALTSNYMFYINYFAEALLSSLLGGENAKALNCFKSSSMDVIVGFNNTNLFPGSDIDAKQPIVKTVTNVDESCGYYTSATVEKYYTFAFFDLAEEQGWYYDKFPNSGDQFTVQSDFVYGIQQGEESRQAAMLIEGSYWHNEASEKKSLFKTYELTKGSTREVRWMSLPVNIFESVTGENNTVTTSISTKESVKGEPIILTICEGGYIGINKNYENDTEIMTAIKDYLQFIYSDEELSKKAVQGAYCTMVDFTVNESDYANSDSYTKAFFNLIKNSTKIYPYGDSDVYKNHSAELTKGSQDTYFTPDRTGKNIYTILTQKTATEAYKDRVLLKADWNSYFGSNSQVAEARTDSLGADIIPVK